MFADQEIIEVKNTKLSICIATFNRAKYIGETIESIISQLPSEVELVVVDGASPDNTSEVMGSYLSRYPHIRYFRESTNSGVDADYDKAVGYAVGEYCWLMTDDDLLRPEAISRVLTLVDGTLDLVVVNSEIRNVDFSKILQPKFLSFSDDREYGMEDGEKFFSEVANCLSFIGGVVVRRCFWLERERSRYYGTLFVHVGVIFQHPPVKRVRVIAEPLIIIRYGNASWSSRGFEIWMFKWPKLVWSFDDFSDNSKNKICSREPWKNNKQLALQRAIGGYSLTEYKQFIETKVNGASRFFPLAIASTPGWMINSFTSLYCALINRKALSGVYDISRSRHATWISRFVARILGV